MFQHKRTHFSDWYRDVLFDADVLDQRFPVKGCNVWKAYGTAIIDNLMTHLEQALDHTEHVKTYFPLLISEDIFGRESQHLRGFEDQVFWIHRAGKHPLSRRLIIRPTSETAMYYMFSLWIRSHADLPLKVYQTVSVFRYETKSTHPLIRDREMWPFNEAHTVHATLQEAQQQITVGVQLYRDLFTRLALPSFIVEKPQWELFPGAIQAYEFYTLMPDNRVVETGSVNNLGQAFSKVFNITFEQEDGSHEYAYQTCYGQSERLLASVIGIHGDDHGLVLPSSIAPTLVVIIPILYADHGDEVIMYAKTVEGILRREKIPCVLDLNTRTPGEKFYYWEKRGIPIRLEIGFRETRDRTVTLVHRHTLERRIVSLDNMISEIHEARKTIDRDLLRQAEHLLKQHTGDASTFPKIVDSVKQGKAIIRVPFCEGPSCKDSIEANTSMEIIGFALEPSFHRCIACNSTARKLAYLAKTY